MERVSKRLVGGGREKGGGRREREGRRPGGEVEGSILSKHDVSMCGDSPGGSLELFLALSN